MALNPENEILNSLRKAANHTHPYVDHTTPTSTANRNTLAAGISPTPTTTSTNVGDQIGANKYNEILDVLQQFLDHQHVYYDDYGTNCNCNCCDCNTIRGAL